MAWSIQLRLRPLRFLFLRVSSYIYHPVGVAPGTCYTMQPPIQSLPHMAKAGDRLSSQPRDKSHSFIMKTKRI